MHEDSRSSCWKNILSHRKKARENYLEKLTAWPNRIQSDIDFGDIIPFP